MDPDGAMENARGVSHSSLDGAKGAAHRSHRPGDEVEQDNYRNPRKGGIFR